MLQFNPSYRGKKVTDSSSETEVETETALPVTSSPSIVSFKMLSNTLSTQFFQVHAPTKRIAFYVGTSTKVSKVQEWIARDIGLAPENQLIITIDGVEVKGSDTAAAFIEVDIQM